MSLAAAALLLALTATEAEAPKERIAILELRTNGVDPKVASTFTALLAVELTRSGRFEVVSKDDVAALLGVLRQRELLGCDRGDCLAEAGNLVDARWVVTGSIGALGGALVVDAQLIDSRKARVANRIARRYPTQDALAADPAGFAEELLATPATLALYNQVDGASVFVDDRFVGTMPVEALPLKAGKHTLRAERSDHLPWAQDVEAVAGRTARLRVELDSIAGLEARSVARRWWAGGALVGAVALAGGAFLLHGEAVELSDEYDGLDARLATQDELDDLAGRSKQRYVASYGLAGVAVGAAGLAAYLFFVDPHADRLEASASR